MTASPRGNPLAMSGGPVFSGRWEARPGLLVLAVALLLPALTIYSAAILRTLGVSQPYTAVQAVLPPFDAPLPLRLTTGWALTGRTGVGSPLERSGIR